MALTKKQRKQVWDKSDGRCWYCGDKLPDKGWHADHVAPVLRDSNWERGKGFVQTGTKRWPERDNVQNIVPACRPCNLMKHTFTVEEFRRELAMQIRRGRDHSVNWRTAERFGLIEVKETPVVFWFEKRAHNTN